MASTKFRFDGLAQDVTASPDMPRLQVRAREHTLRGPLLIGKGGYER